MRIDLKKYDLDTKFDISIKIAHITDIHFAKNYKFKRLEMVKNKLKKINPNYICITGDIIDTYNVIKENSFKEFINWLNELSNIAKVIISIGNHEYIEEVNDGYIEQKDIEWLKQLRSEKIVVLDNQIYVDNNITFIGFNPCNEYYSSNEVNILESDNRKLDRLIFKIKNTYNILLLHTPFFLFNHDNYKEIHDFDKINLVLCGHTHGGMIPAFIPGNFGVIAPSRNFFPKNVRGRKKINNTIIIIGSGITKLSRTSKLTRFTDLYGANINIIKINKKY